MKILVAGARGQVARALEACAARHGRHVVVSKGRPGFDLLEPQGLERTLGELTPDLVVNAAAYTAVDAAERNPATAYAINGDGAGALAALAAKHDRPIIHLSTDYVFDGSKVGAYLEEDATGPTGVYGRSKLAGEAAVAAANPRHIIVRTAWVYAAYGSNFVRTMLRLAKERPELRVVADQRGNPTYAVHLAEAILAIADRMGALRPTPWGIYHAAGTGETTWHEFALAILNAAPLLGIAPVPVLPITTGEYPVAAKRPANSCLDCGKLQSTFAVRLPHWREGLRACIAELALGNANPG